MFDFFVIFRVLTQAVGVHGRMTHDLAVCFLDKLELLALLDFFGWGVDIAVNSRRGGGNNGEDAVFVEIFLYQVALINKAFGRAGKFTRQQPNYGLRETQGTHPVQTLYLLMPPHAGIYPRRRHPLHHSSHRATC